MCNDFDRAMWHMLADNLSKHGSKIAAIDAKRSVTYAEFVAEAGRVTDWLRARGIRPGDRVLVHLRKSIDEAAAMFGAWKAGAVVVNVNSHWSPAQLSYVAKDSRARAVILTQASLKTLQGDHALSPDTAFLVQGKAEGLAQGADLWTALAADSGSAPDEIDPLGLAMIIYTSGSTGAPKGVMLSHRNIRAGAISVAQYLGLTQDDRLLSVLPYSFDAGLNQLTTMMLLGGTIVHQPLTMPAEVVRMAQEQAVTTIAGVPPLWNQIVRLLDASPTDLPALRRVTNTGGKIPPNILELMPKVFPGVDIFLMYGLTEAFRSTYLPPAKFAAKMGSIGQQIPNAQVFAIKHGEGIAGPGEQGELVHAGPLVSMGYWEKPEVTALKIRSCPELAHLLGDDPVVYSGDLVRVDQDGDLWFVSRMDEMIKTLGFRLSPTEVEDGLSQSGLVTDVVAYGVDHPDFGQAVHVSVTYLPGAEQAALAAHCARTMPHYMRPLRFHAWQGAMPRTASGKLDRPAIIRTAKEDTVPSE
ncbi:AMP-binding protein [Paracoccus laeviglucosivorans]|uniref:Acyl-CoA synthetase (AMP-forming)/AMP-acid ligase II n=1 Tax=Paracoccus laeviglucosivorans TaxID=1197861 RepID=A0A521BQI7_9RHOB|nr:AMP-binding protein [Paracoccus laeviglucosivorans]SMO49422.1 Acyl-CoA synthetase (AMP-forming)/AMP-acid ligase II [Paracoccus laeviglucosivorans]